MNKQISLEQYRTMDLTIMAVLLAASQIVIQAAATLWFPEQLYIVSPVAAVVTLVMMRWGIWAAVHAALGGIVLTAASGDTLEQGLIYTTGNLLALLVVPLLKLLGKEKIRQSGFLSLMMALAVQLLMLLGRALVAFVLKHEPLACLHFITTDFLSVLFTLLVIWIARKADGLFEDQKHYLLRVQRERENERRDQF